MQTPNAESWPRISLVTAVYNGEPFLGETIQSIIGQGYPNLEYFIVDGGSTDGTIDVIRKYEKEISGWISEPDRGMYDALNKGFARTTGEIMGWLNADDKLHPRSLFTVAGVFRDLAEVEWITGRPTWFNEKGEMTREGEVERWSQYRFWLAQTGTSSRNRLFGGGVCGKKPAGISTTQAGAES